MVIIRHKSLCLGSIYLGRRLMRIPLGDIIVGLGQGRELRVGAIIIRLT